MTRIFLAFLLLLAPTAAAGVHVDADALPQSSNECSWGDDGYSNSGGWNSNTSWWYWSYGSGSSYESCEGSPDLARANVTSNDNDAASAEAGSVSSWSESQSESWYSQGQGASSNDSYYSSYWGYGSNSAASSSRSGIEAEADTFAGGASAFHGCESSEQSSSWYQYDDSYSSYGNGSYSSYYQSGGWTSASDDSCGQSALVRTGVTTLSAGKTSGCSSSAWSGSGSSWSSGGNGYSYSANETSEDCADGVYAQAGDERVFAGSQSECDAWTYQHNDSGWNQTSYATYDQCVSRTGVFGPDGFALYWRDLQQSWCRGADAGSCEGGSEERSDVGVEHDLVGGVFLPLP